MRERALTGVAWLFFSCVQLLSEMKFNCHDLCQYVASWGAYIFFSLTHTHMHAYDRWLNTFQTNEKRNSSATAEATESKIQEILYKKIEEEEDSGEIEPEKSFVCKKASP